MEKKREPRQTGYYWVRFASENKDRIAYFESDTNRWFFLSMVWTDKEHPFSEIDERPLTREHGKEN